MSATATGPAEQSEDRAAARRAPEVDAQARRAAELDRLAGAFRHVFRTLNRLRGRDTHLGGSELSQAQFELLIELYERGELAAGELAAAARLTPATVTQMLDHLAAQGHVERVRSQTDRRVVVSRLTAGGRGKIEAKRAAWQGRWQAALEGLQESELRAARRVLERLGAAFDDARGDEACGRSQDGVQRGSKATLQPPRS